MCNKSLADENRRLQKELEEFRVVKLAVCTSCEKVAAANNTAAFTLEKVKSIFTRGVPRKWFVGYRSVLFYTQLTWTHSICKML